MNIKSRVGPTIHRLIASIVSSATNAYFSNYYYSKRWHPHDALLVDARDEAVAYIKQHMPDALIRRDELAVLDHATRHVSVDGLFMEFGVRSGMTINHLAKRNRSTVIHGFDSFEGLPEAWSGYSIDRGAFGGEGVPRVADNVELHIGWFDDTLGPFLADHDGPAALVHIDSDIYSSANTVLTELFPRIVPGTVIVFNEYFNYPNWRQHEYRAFQEFVAAHDVEYEYLCWAMYEVAVVIRSITH